MGFLNARSMGNSWEFSRADLSSWKISSGSIRFHQPFSFQIFNWYIYIYRGTIARINLRQTITNYIHIRRQLICFIMFICLGYSSVFIDSLSTVYTAYIHVILWHLMDCDSPLVTVSTLKSEMWFSLLPRPTSTGFPWPFFPWPRGTTTRWVNSSAHLPAAFSRESQSPCL